MKKKQIGYTYKKILFLLCSIFFVMMQRVSVQAAGGSITYGSESYVWEEGTTNLIGIYVSGDEVIEEYDISITYDEEMLRYVDGATSQSGNTLYLRGTGNQPGYRFMLQFEAISAGRTELNITSVICTTAMKPTVVSGNEVLQSERQNFQMELGSAPINIQHTASSKLAELTIEPIDLEGFASDVTEYNIEVPGEVENLQISYIPEDQEANVTVSNTSLKVGDNIITVSVQSTNETTDYVIHVKRNEVIEVPAETPEPTPEPTIEPTSEPSATPSEELITEPVQETERQEQKLSPILLIGCLLVLLLVIGYLAYSINLRIKEAEQRKRNKDVIDVINLESTVISVSNVTMKFKMAKDEVSSLKEYFIKLIKRQNQYSYLTALNNVSFDIKQGEVVGIIGTNGSGKSTILKIISGAITPTKGSVTVDTSKVQILTLGTGFDMELTARENVYLNGSIIGYSKEYIDKKYDDIVKFAELEGFMEERMKNFSSGMVSRLGFAIATMRDAPDILILDEVLSVGDMFFRKKSEKRIKEMIHSGATILIVSHSMETIIKNCTKVVWIEKGILKMIGAPELVCDAYRKSQL